MKNNFTLSIMLLAIIAVAAAPFTVEYFPEAEAKKGDGVGHLRVGSAGSVVCGDRLCSETGGKTEMPSISEEVKSEDDDHEMYDEIKASGTANVLPQDLLFVQTATSGTFVQEGDKYILTLNEVGDTLFFTDRPQRISGMMSTMMFADTWCKGTDNFDENPPNAALQITGADASEDVIIVELLNPVYDAETKTLQYEAVIIPGAHEGKLVSHVGLADNTIPESFGHATLFIDDSAACVACQVGLGLAAGALIIGGTIATAGSVDALSPVIITFLLDAGVDVAGEAVIDMIFSGQNIFNWVCKQIPNTC